MSSDFYRRIERTIGNLEIGNDVKLYLSSQGVGRQSAELVQMVGENARTAVIANGVDHYDKHSRETRVRKEKQALRSIGLKPEELDLRKYFGDPGIPRPRFVTGHGFEGGTSGTVADLIRHYELDTAGIQNFALRSFARYGVAP